MDTQDSVTDGAPQAPAVQSTSPADVTAATGTGDRPVENLAAETNRKFGKLQQQLDAVLQHLASQRPAVQAPTTPTAEDTTEDLWARAQQGDRKAFEEYQRRIASAEVQRQAAAQSRVAMVNGQLQALMTRYPVLNDPSHALTQAVNQAYALFQANGYPANRATLLEAAKTAIADRPDLIAELHAVPEHAREQQRRSATQVSQAGQTGSTVRRQPASTTNNPKVDPVAAALATRMGVKDPAGAMKRFEERQARGASAFGSVGAFIPSSEDA